METHHEAGRPNCHRPPPSSSQYPWLVLFHGKKNCNKQAFYDLSQQRKKVVKSVPELQDSILHFSRHGWLVLRRKESLYLWNPTSLESIPLPHLELDLRRVYEPSEMVLTLPPENPDSVLVVFVFLKKDDHRKTYICRINDDDRRWIQTNYSQETVERDYWLSTPWLVDSLVHSMDGPENLFPLETEISDCDDVKIIAVKEPGDPKYYTIWCEAAGYPLVEYRGEFYRFDVEFGGVELNEVMNIVVFKLDFRDWTWKQIKTLGDKVFFLDRSKGYCFPAINLETNLRNKVLFTLYRDNNFLYTYDMEDQSISIAAPFLGVPSPWESPEWLLPGKDNLDLDQDLNLDLFDDDCSEKNDLVLQDRPCDLISSGNEDEECVLQLDDLPDGVFEVVFKHLGPIDYVNFRAASTRLRNLAPPNISKDQMKNHISSPWLIRPFSIMDLKRSKRVVSEEEMISVTYANFSMVHPNNGVDRTFYITAPEITKNSRIYYSRYGWLLMADIFKRLTKMFLFNPLTKEVISLTELPGYPMSAFFLASPDSPECVVVAFCYDATLAKIYPIDQKNGWESIELVDQTEVGAARWEYYQPHEISHFYPAIIDNTFYFLGHKRSLFALTVENATFCALKVRIPSNGSYYQNFLVACDGELLAVLVGGAGTEYWIKAYKLNQAGGVRVWNEVSGLGNNCLYLSNVSAFAVKCDDPKMKNRIYFNRVYDEYVVYYSMETRKLHYTWMKEGCLVEGTVDDFFKCKEHLLSFWFEQ